jgi:ankyrin repeat protein
MRAISLFLVLWAGSALAQPDLAAQRDALQTAIVKRDAPRVTAFVRGGMNLDFNFDDLLPRQRSGESPLTMALHRGFLDIAKILLESGADPRRIDGFGEAPIHAARSPEAMTLLVTYGADANGVNQRGWTALAEAVQRGNLGAVDALLANGARIDAIGRAPDLLTLAAESRKPELIVPLLERGVDPKSPPTQVLWLLIDNGDTERARAVIARGADPNARNARGESLMARALFRSRWEVADALIAAGASATPDEKVQVARLASLNPRQLGKFDLNATDARGHTAITSLIVEQPMAIRAVRAGQVVGEIPAPDNVARVKALLDAGADPNRKYQDLTPLMLAIGQRPLGRDFTGVLLAAGGRIEFDALIPKPTEQAPAMPIGAGQPGVAPHSRLMFNDYGVHTGMRVGPLTWAVMYSAGDVALGLLERDRRIEPADRNLLYFAAGFDQWELVKVALRYTKEVDAADRADVTPLMFAAQSGRADVVQALLAAGARVNTRSDRTWPPLLERNLKEEIGGAIAGHSRRPPRLVGGYTALGAAKERGHADVVRILAAAGGRE